MTSTFDKVSPEDWKESILKELKGKPFETVVSRTQDGHDLLPFYSMADRKGIRGVHGMGPWVCRQDVWGKDAKALNVLILEALVASVSSIGVNLDEGHKLDELFANVQLDILEVHLKTSRPSDHLETLKSFLARSSKELKDLSGSWDHDPLTEALIRGAWKQDAVADFSEVFDMMPLFGKDFGMLSIRGDQFHLAGATSEQELLYSLATAKAYLDLAKEKGIDLQSLVNGIRFQLAVDTDFLESVSKFMVMRILWANLAKAYGCDARAVQLTARSSGWTLAPVDSDTNLLRSSTEALAAIVGGCDDLVLHPHDGKCDSFSLRMSRNIQHLLKHESYLDKFQNPVEGAYAFESLAASMSEHVWGQLRKMDEQGGWLKTVEEGLIQEELHEQAKAKAKALLDGSRPWLGVNLYASKEGPALSNIAWTSPESTNLKALHFPIFQVA